MTKVVEYPYTISKPILAGLGLVMVILIGFLDHVTGPEIFLSVFYLIPIFLVTWYSVRWAGIMISIASGITWFIADFTSGHIYSHPAIPYWNMVVRLSSFLIITFILSGLRTTLEHEKEIARTDPLAGIANGRYFVELADMEIKRARRYSHPFTVIYIDLDNFKTVNDNFGHSSGDALLRSVANAIRNGIRATDTVARLGGDEFVILLPETAPEPARVISQKIEKIGLNIMQKNEWPVTFSMGVVTFIDSPSTVDEMLKIADGLMYAAKSNGRNTIKYEIVGNQKSHTR